MDRVRKLNISDCVSASLFPVEAQSNPKLAHVECIIYKAEVGQVYFRAIRFYRVSPW
jgi:hypothetical protein